MIVIVNCSVFFLIGGSRVASTFCRDFNPVQEFDVCTFVEFSRLAGCRVGDDEPSWSSFLNGQGFSIKSVNDNTGVDDCCVSRDAGRKIIMGCVERDPEIVNRGLDEIEDPFERQSGSFAVRYFLSDVGNLNLSR